MSAIEKDKVVSFKYRLSQIGGELLEQSDDAQPVVYLHGHGNILPAMEMAMEGKKAGDKIEIELSPEQGYGVRDPERIGRVPIKHLLVGKKKLMPGMRVQLNTPQGPMDVRILKVGKFNVDVDANHPLADMALHFAVEILDIRNPTDDELQHGHAHGPGGHHHD